MDSDTDPHPGWKHPFRKVSLFILITGGLLLDGKNIDPPERMDPGNPKILEEQSKEDLWLFAIRLDQRILSSAFPGFPMKAGFRLPLGELCRVLDLAVQVDLSRGLAEGFLIQEKRRFRLDVFGGTVEIQGNRRAFDSSLVEMHSDDIYVDSGLLAEWLPLDLEILKRTALITVSPRELLPLQARWSREQAAGQAKPGTGVRKYPRISDAYHTFEVPFVDESLRITTPSRSETKRKLLVQSTTFAAGDWLGLSSSLYAVAGTQGGVSEFRMTMGRRDPNAELLGPLQATEFAFGEILNPGLNLIAQPYAGTGMLVTNLPLLRGDAYDRQSFQGNLAPGWQVELYRNRALLAFQSSRSDGRYEFLNLPLYYGLNDFRLVFYGPQGQKREEIVRFDVSESQTPKGAFQYLLVGIDAKIAGARGHVETRYGVSQQVATSLAVARTNFDGTVHTYTVVGLQGFWKPLSASFTAAHDALGGMSEELSLRTRLGSLSLNAKRAQLQGGFSSEVFNPSSGLLTNRSSIEASALLSSREYSWLTMDFGISRDELVAGGLVERIYNRLSTSTHGYFFSNEWRRSQNRGGIQAFSATTTGDLIASKFYRDFSLRGQANYQLSGTSKLNGFSVQAETPRFPLYLVRAGVNRTLSTGETLFLLGANKSQGTFSLGLDVSYSTRNHLVVDLTLRVGLGREPRLGHIQTQAQGLASQGAVSARVFVDANANGIRDAQETDVQGVGFLVNGAPHSEKTNSKGVAFLTHLNADLDADVSIAAITLEDPLMRPAIPGVRVTPRAGHVAMVDVPLAIFGEVNGTVFLKEEGGHKELPAIGLELLASDGHVLRTVRSAYDGFYMFEELPPGTYQVRIPESEILRFKLIPPSPRGIQIALDGTIIDGLDFLIVPTPSTKVKP